MAENKLAFKHSIDSIIKQDAYEYAALAYTGIKMTANMTQDEIENQLCDFLRTNILADDIAVSPDTELSLLGVDSFSLMELVLFIERRFGLELPAEALTPDNIASVRTLSAYCWASLTQNRHA